MNTNGTKAAASWKPACVLSIAGSDSGGGAGLQADIKTVSALGGYSATAVSAVTVQNTLGVRQVMPVPAPIVCAQVLAVLDDIRPQAVKISMLPEPAVAAPLADILREQDNIVIDPVMVATSGHSLVENSAMRHIVKNLFPLARIVTPNLEETRALTGIFPQKKTEFERAAKMILDMGPRAVLLKGGHSASTRRSSDYLLCAEADFAPLVVSSPKSDSNNLHGTGCTLSAAIAFFLASGNDLTAAVVAAKDYIYHAIKTGKNMQIGQGHGPVNHLFAPKALKKLK
ncbi:MAG: bifunctional hydroxymethylpyrimidine kinase/phosphomethylpyrimidine kinase [Bacteroides sp.]|nr:bifunctional hydroxymethylpyrimidine kinase/phosphomethylpyrimidine kinase [Bacteroides sp.]